MWTMESPARIPVVAGVISRWNSVLGQPEVLLFQRDHSDIGGGFWEFPGGKIEKGESDAQALIRELEEEIAIRVQVRDFLGKSYLASPSGRQFELRVYFVQGPVAEIELREHLGMKWVSEQTLVLAEVAEGDRPLMAPCFAKLRKTQGQS
jgi:mutator protein MutT